ncbi:MAG: hypothetical protein WCH01_13155 [Methylococcaceae bacterium]
MPRFWIVVPLVAACHFVLQGIIFFMNFGLVMLRFDTGSQLSCFDHAIRLVSAVANFPLVTLATMLPLGDTGSIGWLVFVANSIAWGITAWLCVQSSGWPVQMPSRHP